MTLSTYDYPNIVKLVLDKNIKLHLQHCKVHKTLAGVLCLVSPKYDPNIKPYGYFQADGTFTARKPAFTKEMWEELEAVETRGLEAVKEISKLTGVCCVCGKTLTAEESIADGIGPICAGKF